MSIRSWFRTVRKPRDKKRTAEDVEKQQDALKADIGGTLFMRDSAKSEAKRLSD
jgi:hypothetical protein